MKRDTRTNLIDAAQARLAEHGYAGTSIRDLAGDVGIKESSVYKHFPSKQAVLEAVLARAEERVAATAAALGVRVDDPDAAAQAYDGITLDRLTEIAQGFLTMWLHDAEFVPLRRVLTLEQYRTPEAGRLLRELVATRALEFQTALFARLIAGGGFKPADPEAVALAFWGPIVTILTLAEAPGAEGEARRMLDVHLGHFRATHVAGEDAS